jgi:hypothetical protein
VKAVHTSIDMAAHFTRWWNVGGDPTTGVGAYCINGVCNDIIIACVWCELEGLVKAERANNRAWGQHTNIVVLVLLLLLPNIFLLLTPLSLPSSLSSSLSLSPSLPSLSSMWGYNGIGIVWCEMEGGGFGGGSEFKQWALGPV